MTSLASRLFLVTITVGLLAACGAQTQQSTDAKSQQPPSQQTTAAPPPAPAPPAAPPPAPAKPATPAPSAQAQRPPATSPPAPAPAPTPPPKVEAPQTLTINVARANMREAPDTKAKILQVLTRGTRVTVVSKGNQWYRVKLENGTEGWVAESVVTPAP
jgi:uncharacterized protein YgiM (DUF1202 family)